LPLLLYMTFFRSCSYVSQSSWDSSNNSILCASTIGSIRLRLLETISIASCLSTLPIPPPNTRIYGALNCVHSSAYAANSSRKDCNSSSEVVNNRTELEKQGTSKFASLNCCFVCSMFVENSGNL